MDSNNQITFAEKMRTTSDNKKSEIEKLIEEKYNERMLKQQTRITEVRDQLFTTLTAKYHDTIKKGINNAATTAKREKYINFSRDDFRANCHGVGFPQQVMADWLKEMCDPESIYVPVAEEDVYDKNNKIIWNKGCKMHFQGVSYDVWNNKAFTTVFTW